MSKGEVSILFPPVFGAGALLTPDISPNADKACVSLPLALETHLALDSGSK